VAPADPPPDDPDADYGDPPDWSTCSAGWHGQYFNLPSDHPDLEADPPAALDDLDWWDDSRLTMRRFDGSLDMGDNWWPVDEGFEGDPAYFAARWTAWVRVTDAGAAQVVLDADTVAWLFVNREQVARVDDTADDTAAVEVTLRAGQFPVELRYGQLRADASALRFRFATGDVQLCYPAF
jgi:hypothetical protein